MIREESMCLAIHQMAVLRSWLGQVNFFFPNFSKMLIGFNVYNFFFFLVKSLIIFYLFFSERASKGLSLLVLKTTDIPKNALNLTDIHCSNTEQHWTCTVQYY